MLKEVVALSLIIADLGTGSVWSNVSIACSRRWTKWACLLRMDSELEKESQGLAPAFACDTSPIGSARALDRIVRRMVRLDHGSGLGL